MSTSGNSNLLGGLTLLDVKNCDNQSDGGNSGTTWGSREDLNEYVTKHGFKDVSELAQDRFRVDRRKLEQMLTAMDRFGVDMDLALGRLLSFKCQSDDSDAKPIDQTTNDAKQLMDLLFFDNPPLGGSDALVPADVFFAKVMDDTDTFITWPSRLKLGAKSKKDPHVRIAGSAEGVEAAKDRIMTILHTRNNRITMKMEVSYTDHSHIIGKGGHCIKRVMEETQCHVHFPDSNRSNTTEKSNQVSISGDLERVEHARSRVRELIPLIFGFEPPIMAQHMDASSPYILKIQEQYKVQVMFKTRSKLHAVIVLVKGVEWEVELVKQATLLLMEYMCDTLVSQTPVQMAIQISPQHHDIVLGQNHSNLKAIMNYTNCRIMFPDAHDPNIPNLRKSNINISGTIHNVYKARQLLIGSLPLLIIFDLPEEGMMEPEVRMRPEQIAEIEALCGVTINVRQKCKQQIKVCIVKGVEKFADNLYKARNLMLNLDGPIDFQADIPQCYHLPSTNEIAPPPTTPVWPPPPPPPFVPRGYLHNTSQPPSFVYHNTSRMTPPVYHQRHLSDSSVTTNTSNNTSFYSTFEAPSMKNLRNPAGADSVFASPPYESKRLTAFRTMQSRPSSAQYRQPTGAWAGQGFSHTSPAGLVLQTQSDGATTSAALNTSNFLDHTPPHYLNRVRAQTTWTDLSALLSYLDLERYIPNFVRHEIDLTTFTTLNDADLLEIGITAFGSRRKLLLAIGELKHVTITSSAATVPAFSLAPGAERKRSTSSGASSTLTPQSHRSISSGAATPENSTTTSATATTNW